MGIQSNASTEEVVGGIKTFSGLTNVNVLAVNPTMAELHAIDIKVKSEPNYSVTIGDEEYFKITFWLNNADGNFKLEILMQPKMRQSQTGKYQWMNNVGQSTWSEEAPTYEWWKTEGQRQAYTGEETLINFVKAWANVASGDEVYFDTIDAIVKGNLTELKALITSLTTKYFGRVKPQRDDLFIKALNDDYGSFNADFNADLAWGPHTATASLVTPDAPEEDADWTDEPVAAGNGATSDDLPF